MLIPFGVFSAAGAGNGGGAGSFELITSTILTGSQASVTFDVSTYASTYKHLQVRFTGKNTSSDSSIHMQFNSDTGSNYNWHMLYTVDGSSVSSYSSGSTASMRLAYSPLDTSTGGNYSGAVVDLVDAFSNSKNKTIKSLGGFATARFALFSGLWRNTNAITSVKLLPTGGDFITGSRFSIYGIRG